MLSFEKRCERYRSGTCPDTALSKTAFDQACDGLGQSGHYIGSSACDRFFRGVVARPEELRMFLRSLRARRIALRFGDKY